MDLKDRVDAARADVESRKRRILDKLARGDRRGDGSDEQYLYEAECKLRALEKELANGQ